MTSWCMRTARSRARSMKPRWCESRSSSRPSTYLPIRISRSAGGTTPAQGGDARGRDLTAVPNCTVPGGARCYVYLKRECYDQATIRPCTRDWRRRRRPNPWADGEAAGPGDGRTQDAGTGAPADGSTGSGRDRKSTRRPRPSESVGCGAFGDITRRISRAQHGVTVNERALARATDGQRWAARKPR